MSPFKEFKLGNHVIYESPNGVVPKFTQSGYVRYIGTEYLVFGNRGDECAVSRNEARLLKLITKE